MPGSKRKRKGSFKAPRAHNAAEIAKLEEQLRLADAKFAGIVGISADAVIAIDESQRIVLFNRGAEQIFGYVSDEILGQPLTMLLPESSAALHPAHIRHFADAGVSARHMGARNPVQGRRKSGEVFPAEVSISKVDLGTSRMFTAVLRDVTERMRSLAAEQAARAAAEAAVIARDNVLAVVSHDLRNPLAAIKLCTELLEQLSADPEAGPLLRIIGRSVEWATRIILDLLDLASIEAGALSVYPERTTVAAVLVLVRPSLDAFTKAHSFEITESPGLPPLMVDADRIAQVLANLVGNAAKFTPAGGTISLRAERNGAGSVRISVRDSGSGIPADDLPHIFDRFWHTRAPIMRGAGLGLAIAKGIVEAHGGHLTAESRVGEGSTFAFTIPGAG